VRKEGRRASGIALQDGGKAKRENAVTKSVRNYSNQPPCCWKYSRG